MTVNEKHICNFKASVMFDSVIGRQRCSSFYYLSWTNIIKQAAVVQLGMFTVFSKDKFFRIYV